MGDIEKISAGNPVKLMGDITELAGVGHFE
jgi:hypothetical protein